MKSVCSARYGTNVSRTGTPVSLPVFVIQTTITMSVSMTPAATRINDLLVS